MSAWHVWTTAPMAVAPALETLFEEVFALDACPPTISSFEVVEDHIWRIEAYFDTKPDLTELVAALDAWRDETGHQAEDIQCEALEDRDWVSESQKLLSPVTAGKLFVHGSHDRENRRAFGINLQIEAGQAFGTGQHATTMGCLLMLDRLARRIDRPQAMLDLAVDRGFWQWPWGACGAKASSPAISTPLPWSPRGKTPLSTTFHGGIITMRAMGLRP
ncbi:hypothetical protein JCM17844_22340 [Iodidimonas gelatinilytica]|uniref:50S ribosomal protein L11 methyltransferase n=1 Tax=Iodidimonas gelatinilytica TaxID=1236966 RepID=A0A5A7MRM2_9PROT|nr:hypothetical protein JCM17844_22340 [Iodidimonas gelatinilytica]